MILRINRADIMTRVLALEKMIMRFLALLAGIWFIRAFLGVGIVSLVFKFVNSDIIVILIAVSVGLLLWDENPILKI